MTVVNDVCPRIKQDKQDGLSKKEKDALQALAVKSLSNKFNLMTVTSANNHNKNLTNTYTVNATLQELFRCLKQFDMHRVFLLVTPDATAINGSVLPDVVDLLEKNNDQTLKLKTVQDSILHMKQWGGEYDVKNLQWNQELLEKSSTAKLKTFVLEQMYKIKLVYHGGPLYFYLMMRIITRATTKSTCKLIERIKNLSIHNIRGENVLQETSLIRGAIICLGDQDPTDINNFVLKIYQTSSYPQLNDIFRLMELNKRL